MANSSEYRTIQSCYSMLTTALKQDPVTIGNDLLTKHLIPPIGIGQINEQKLSELLLDKIKVAPARYHDVITVFSQHRWLEDIVKALQFKHEEITKSQLQNQLSDVQKPIDEAASAVEKIKKPDTEGCGETATKKIKIDEHATENELQEIEKKKEEISKKEKRVQERMISHLQDLQKSKQELGKLHEEVSILEQRMQQIVRRDEKDSLQKWNAKGKGLNVAVLGETTTICLAGDDDGRDIATRNVQGDLIPLMSNKKCTITSTGGNQYEISYKPTIPGLHKLHVTVDGGHIKGSPFTVWVGKKFSSPICIFEGMRRPQGIAFSKNGSAIVVEYTGCCVSIFKPTSNEAGTINYQRTLQFGSEGKENGEFDLPCGVAVDDDDNILVTDGKNDRIQKFTSQGKFMQAVGDKQHPIKHPAGIGIHPQNKRIYVTERETCSVQILNPDLSPFKRFGKKGKGESEFNDPKDVAFDSNGDVYVVDNENHRIQVFTPDGKFLREIGQRVHTVGKRDDGELYFPTAICIDSDDIVYITELYKCRVSIFTHKGTFLTLFGSSGREPGQFNDPRGIAINENGAIYVSDHGNDRVQLF